MSEAVDTAVETVSNIPMDKVVGGIGLGLSVTKLAMDYSRAEAADEAAEKAGELQLQQIRAQEELRKEEEARQRSLAMREARIKKAAIAAQASDVGGSIITSPLTSISSSLEDELSYLDMTADVQREQFAIAKSETAAGVKSAKRETSAKLWESVYNTGEDTLSFISLYGEQ